ncbi:glycosyltransferase [Ktedonosporobacter rubrisoli]|uniref:Glycosyltransferase n=1 Tax=Ktedonosporobacter rubrisoli TaxID=2509675 RepID=A0A4P6JR36_KTERU|nr:glycosyltransferase [Ktedonosporobacter rubrisoli]QBD77909.1 glycosyltransferase [Ktedonosporobacter rubrisoli]
MSRPSTPFIRGFAYSLLATFALDRVLKLAAITHFFHSDTPQPSRIWPTVTLLQPITRGASGLANNLRSRTQLDYPGHLEHLFICDVHDEVSQKACTSLMAELPDLDAQLLLVDAIQGPIAAKTEKLLAALPRARGEILWFVDDDIALRPDALRIMIPYLFQPQVGAVFGLACYTNWQTLWSSLMSIFVNANALLSYIPLTYLADPFTITGHCFALRREIFQRAGGLTAMEERIDDDHELARRVRHLGLRCVQTPMIYDVNNELSSRTAYTKQMKRWFIFPRQAMAPYLTLREQGVTLLGSITQLIPALLALLALFTWKRPAFQALITSLGLFGAIYALGEICYLQRRTPASRWPLLPIVALLAPLQVLWSLAASPEIEWRGQRWRILRGGKMEVLS